MLKDIQIQQENYRRYKRAETWVARIVGIMVVLAIILTLTHCTSYPQVDANGNPATEGCSNGYTKMPTMAPPMKLVCVPNA